MPDLFSDKYFTDDNDNLFCKEPCGCVFEYLMSRDEWDLVIPCSDTHVGSK